MYDLIDEYRTYTVEMINSIGKESDYPQKIAEILDKRQTIIDSLSSDEELFEFRRLYDKFSLKSLDDELKDLLTKELDKTKKDIIEQKKQRVANNAYTKVNRDGFNLFSKQI